MAADAKEPVAVDAWFESDRVNSVRKLAFFAGIGVMFLRFSLLHQTTTYVLHTNLYLLYLFGIPALMGVVISGGIRRTLSGRPTMYLLGFAVWILFTTVFSTWRGGSVAQIAGFLRADFIVMFVIGGLVLTWSECKIFMAACALGALVNIATTRLFDYTSEGRLSLEFGSIANSNDLAAHLLFVMPFLLWVVLSSDRAKILRLIAFVGVLYGVFVVVKTGSRGAAIALAADFVFVLLRATPAQRLAMLTVSPVLLGIVLMFVPQVTINRIMSLTDDSTQASVEALESSATRRYLLLTSIRYTFENPIFGLGPGQFSIYEGSHNRIIGTHGSWHETHNTFTQVSSETGFPGLFLFLAGIGSMFNVLRKVNKGARARPECRDIALASFCAMLALLGFCVAVTFLSFAYFFYLPAMAGFAVAMNRAARVEFQNRKPLQPALMYR